MASIEQAIAKLRTLKTQLPKIAANEMLNFALNNIKAGKDINGIALKPRKPGTRRDAGRAILVDTGDGRRSLRGVADSQGAHLEGIDYMIYNNEGAHGTVTKRSKRGKSYSAKVNLPQRQYAGDSPAQRERIQKVIATKIIQALT